MNAIEAGASTRDDLDRRVDEAGRDSFPASDPPTWWAGGDEHRPPFEDGEAPCR